MAPHAARIHTLITPGLSIRTKLLVLQARNTFHVGSIPIARSTFRQRQATQGYKIGVKTSDPFLPVPKVRLPIVQFDQLNNK